MSDRKWIQELRSQTPLDEAARVAVHIRLEVLRDALEPALEPPGRDPEPVHQLRVAARRATAAVDQFASTMGKRRGRRLRAIVKRIRRAAGEARDWDVFSIALRERRESASGDQLPGYDFLIGYAAGRRTAAQKLLVEALGGQQGKLRRLTEAAVESVRLPSPSNLHDFARLRLLDLFHDLETTGNGDRNALDRLHRVRIHGKKLRYALEIFGGCCEPKALATCYEAIVTMQEILGRANDSLVSLERLAALHKSLEGVDPIEAGRVAAGFAALAAHDETALQASRGAFEEWWADWRTFDPSTLFGTPADSSAA